MAHSWPSLSSCILRDIHTNVLFTQNEHFVCAQLLRKVNTTPCKSTTVSCTFASPVILHSFSIAEIILFTLARAAAAVPLSIAGIWHGEQTVMRAAHACTSYVRRVSLSPQVCVFSYVLHYLTLTPFTHRHTCLMYAVPRICVRRRRHRTPFHSWYSAWRGDYRARGAHAYPGCPRDSSI